MMRQALIRDAARALRSCGGARAGRGSASSFAAASGLLLPDPGCQLAGLLPRHQRRHRLCLFHRWRKPASRQFDRRPHWLHRRLQLYGGAQSVIGLEGDFDFSGNKNSQLPYYGFTTNTSIDDIFTIRGRVGYTFDRALVYITGGFAGSNNTVSVGNIWTGFAGQQSTWQTGWALGAGLEFMLTNNLSAKAEYLFTSVGSDRYFDFSPNVIQTSVNNSQSRSA